VNFVEHYRNGVGIWGVAFWVLFQPLLAKEIEL
jgi:hypothetical protein